MWLDNMLALPSPTHCSWRLLLGNPRPVTEYHYRPQTKLRNGNVFTSVCQEFYPQEGGVHPLGRQAPRQTLPSRQTPPSQTPPRQADNPLGRQTAPWANTPRLIPPGRHPHPHQTATRADGTHPTRMHSCLNLKRLARKNKPGADLEFRKDEQILSFAKFPEVVGPCIPKSKNRSLKEFLQQKPFTRNCLLLINNRTTHCHIFVFLLFYIN